jgi:hypothetical protein
MSRTSSDSDDGPPQLRPLHVVHRGITTDAIEEEDDDTGEGALPTSRYLRAQHPVPVLLLTGFLGAGKSTLVNYILTSKHGFRVAVVMNEIGDTADIEKAAMVSDPEQLDAAPIDDWVELENGCICCSAKNDLVKSLERLLQQRDRFDYVRCMVFALLCFDLPGCFYAEEFACPSR